MLLKKGSFNNKPILTEASVQMLHTLSTEASQVKYAPPTLTGLNYAMGEWILETNAQGKAGAVTVPSLHGSWPVADLCRNYAYVVITKETSGEESRKWQMDFKATIDDLVGGNCQ
jgi:hypothetical protein